MQTLGRRRRSCISLKDLCFCKICRRTDQSLHGEVASTNMYRMCGSVSSQGFYLTDMILWRKDSIQRFYAETGCIILKLILILLSN